MWVPRERRPPPCAGMETLYPSSEYAMRNAASRTDGYWPYISRKEEPPQELTYGEFPLDFFEDVVTRATRHMLPPLANGADRSQSTFLDLGSGKTGQKPRPL
jgi:hypothetical protein